MEKDIGKIQKSMDTDIVVRIDDFGGRVGLTIREFMRSERYSGFTKAGTRIPADKIKEFRELITSIDEKEIETLAANAASSPPPAVAPAEQKTLNTSKSASTDKKPNKAAKAAPVEGIEEQEF